MRTSTWATKWSSPRFACHRSLRHPAVSQSSSKSRQRDFHDAVTRFASINVPEDDSKVNTNGVGGPKTTQTEGVGIQGPQVPNDGFSNGSSSGPDNGSGSSKTKDPSNYGSASNRARRNRLPKELPPVLIPDWFLERNVILSEDLDARTMSIDIPVSTTTGDKTSSNGPPQQKRVSSLTTEELEKAGKPLVPKEATSVQESDNDNASIRSTAPTGTPSSGNNLPSSAVNAPGDRMSQKNSPPHQIAKIFPPPETLSHALSIPDNVFHEVVMMLCASMILPPPQYVDMALDTKAHTILFCPKNGASRFLIQRIQEWSFSYLNFDYLKLDAQDIAEIGGNYTDDPRNFESGTLSSLGYDISFPAHDAQEQASDQPGQGEGFNQADEGDFRDSDKTPLDYRSFAKSTHQQKGKDVVGIVSMGSIVGDVREAFRSLVNNNFAKAPKASPSNPYAIQSSQELKDSTEDLKMGLLVETLLSAPERKIRAKGYTKFPSRPPSGIMKSEFETDDHTMSESKDTPRPISKNFIILIEDYLQINATHHGSRFLDKLHEVVAVKRSEGKRVLIVGTSSSKEMIPNLSKSTVNDLQAGQLYEPMRTVVIPVTELTNEDVLVREHKRKIRTTNLRHLREMVRRLAPAPEQRSTNIDDWNMEIDSKTAFLVDLEDSVWPIDRVNRVALVALGFLVAKKNLQVANLERALTGIHESDQIKYKWVEEQEKLERETHEKLHKRGSDGVERIRKLRDKCNKHERRLLTGVIDADSIKTTFADIRAPQETIDALKTLTSLSLARPDAFTYGVLASDRISGLLLYGPPGTGKTLLAKAVAKESASTMLEVSGSSIYDMYVGETEKNVRAVFSLAKKLAPCVVFIDEADSILGSRNSSSNRNTHRDQINQFLREWDGMTDTNAFIMVATNRPFDLDEASLRRLPRRLLVDLPIETDREAILKIHLKDEILAPDVSLPKLASETPFYSGSDLKNVCVAAALACVREEFNAAAEHNKKITKDAPNAEKYKYATKRTLFARHFSKGLDEISASISEDMSSLSAIRKFDEKYGDRKGRRKKLGGYGFKTVEESEAKGSDALRVRNQ